jgi:hypothetical protein
LSTKYANTELHKFIRAFVESEGGKLSDVCEEFFEIEYPHSLAPTKYTYQPVIAREKGIELIATGSQAFNTILQQCLGNGIISSVSLKKKEDPELGLKDFFKDSAYNCDYCEAINIENKEITFCTQSPKCYHKINNGRIVSINVIRKQPFLLFQFYFSILLKNKLRKNEETVRIVIDEDGNTYDFDILAKKQLEFIDSEERMELALYDTLKPMVDEKLDSILKDKQTVFDLLLKKQITGRMRNLKRRLEEEKLERSISKKGANVDEEAWKTNEGETLKKEEEALKTTMDIKFLNLLSIKTEKIFFEIVLHNNSKINSAFILGIDSPAQIICPGCGKTFYEGYATEDGLYLCIDCIKQTVDTQKIYSKNRNLPIDATTNEYIEEDKGFLCTVCGRLNSRLFEFKCNHDGQSVCINCCTMCTKCGKLFSISNVVKSKESGKTYCTEHSTTCDNCGALIGIDEYKICRALGKRVCSCTKFSKCSFCEQQYSTEALVDGRCPACNHLVETKETEIISTIIRHDSSRSKTKKWLVGRNHINSVAIAKGFLSDTLFIVEGETITFQKTVPFLNKLRGY